MRWNHLRRRTPAVRPSAIRPTCVGDLLGRIARMEAKLDRLTRIAERSERDADPFEPSADDLEEMHAMADAYAADLADFGGDLPF
jgi:hypothetical protein